MGLRLVSFFFLRFSFLSFYVLALDLLDLNAGLLPHLRGLNILRDVRACWGTVEENCVRFVRLPIRQDESHLVPTVLPPNRGTTPWFFQPAAADILPVPALFLHLRGNVCSLLGLDAPPVEMPELRNQCSSGVNSPSPGHGSPFQEKCIHLP